MDKNNRIRSSLSPAGFPIEKYLWFITIQYQAFKFSLLDLIQVTKIRGRMSVTKHEKPKVG